MGLVYSTSTWTSWDVPGGQQSRFQICTHPFIRMHWRPTLKCLFCPTPRTSAMEIWQKLWISGCSNSCWFSTEYDSHCLETVDVSWLLNEVFHQANMSVNILKNHNASCNDNKPLVWWKSSSVITFQPTKWQEGFEFGKSYGCWCQKICSFLQVSCSSSILIWLSQPLFGWGWKDWFLLHLHVLLLSLNLFSSVGVSIFLHPLI